MMIASRSRVLCRCLRDVRSVTTWSPLASAFNTKIETQEDFKGANVGLFGVPELTEPSGFRVAQENCLREVEELVHSAVTSPTSPEIVKVFDKLSDALCRVADLADFIRVAHPKNDYIEAAEEACFSVGNMVEKLNTHVKLHNSLRKLLDNEQVFGAMNSECRRVAELFMFDFQQSGIHLSAGKRRKVVKLNSEILRLGSEFMQGTQTPNVVARDLLPEHIRNSFILEGDTIKVNGLYTDSPNDIVREVAYKIFLYPNPHQEQLLDKLLSARHDLANLVGYPTYADRALKSSMAQTPQNVMNFLEMTASKIHGRALDEISQLKTIKKKYNSRNPNIMAWDLAFYVGVAKHQKCDINSMQYTPYFSLGTCMEGLSLIFTSLYGIKLEEEDTLPGEIWSPDVKKLAVVHESEGILGYIYCDLYERPGKSQQDCHFTIRGGRCLDDGSYQKPVVVLMCSFPSPTKHMPSLLTHSMMENLFHEMGHAMHSMLARTTYQHVTGTRCSTDFAEVPSVLMEYFANDYRVLKQFAKHYKTGETLPERMISNLCSAKKMFSACDMQQQVYYAILDQLYHGKHPLPTTTTELLSEIQNKYSCLPHVDGTAWQLRFGHLVGYGAKYYSYLLSRAVASLIWQQCFHSNPLDRQVGENYRRKMLALGGGEEPSILVKNMLGQAPSMSQLVEALIQDAF
ncbi:mitochondrial intermediate peptidase-like [Ptychodera flava]|uniref:mitochondrial intermediate peptidase-like n=1 Tax=Ptychodera flava TaxID=63121 RepID=UPI00396A233D